MDPNIFDQVEGIMLTDDMKQQAEEVEPDEDEDEEPAPLDFG